MGSGEPLDNYDNVIKSFQLLNATDGLNISPRNITISTCGMVDEIRALADSGWHVNLAISLHAPNNEKRMKIMPSTRAYKIHEILEAGLYYFKTTGRRVTLEYALIDGVNDSAEDAEELADLLTIYPFHVNIIDLNSVKELSYRRAGAMVRKRFMEVLQIKGVNVTVRASMGSDINGACGQLRNAVENEEGRKRASSRGFDYMYSQSGDEYSEALPTEQKVETAEDFGDVMVDYAIKPQIVDEVYYYEPEIGEEDIIDDEYAPEDFDGEKIRQEREEKRMSESVWNMDNLLDDDLKEFLAELHDDDDDDSDDSNYAEDDENDEE